MAVGVKLRGDGDSLTLWNASTLQHTAELTFEASGLGSVINGTYWTFSTDRNDYYVWYNVTDAAAGVSDPAVDGRVGIPVSVNTATAADASSLSQATARQLAKLSEIGVEAQILAAASAAFRYTVKEPELVTGASAGTFPVGGGGSFVASNEPSTGPDFEIDAKHLIYNSAGNVALIIAQDGTAYNVHASDVHLVRENNLFIAASDSNIWGQGSNLVVKADNLPLGPGNPASALPNAGDGSLVGNASSISGVS